MRGDLGRCLEAARPGSERGRGAGLPAAPGQPRTAGRPAAARHRGGRRRDARARAADPRRRGALEHPVRGVHRGHRGGVGSRDDHRLRLLRRRRLRPRCRVALSVGDRARCRTPPRLRVPGLAAIHETVAGHAAVPAYARDRRILMSKTNRDAARAERIAKAAALRKEQERQEARRRYLMIGGVVAALLVIVVGGWFLSRALDTTAKVDAPAAGSKYGVTIGPKDAPHDVVIYEDFLCPFCGELEAETHEKLATLADD